MKQWTADAILGAVIAVGMGVVILFVERFSVFLIWASGIAIGYGLRIGIVNVWPHIFKPRMAYKKLHRRRLKNGG